MKEKTQKNVYDAFIGEAKAYFRLLAYAEKAKEEEVPQMDLLFRAIAEAERVHATRNLNLVKELSLKTRIRTWRNRFSGKNPSVKMSIRILSKTPKMKAKPPPPWFSARPGTRKAITRNYMNAPS